MSELIPDRPQGYDPDSKWDKNSQQWTTDARTETDGARYKNHIVIVGHRSIYTTMGAE